MSDELLTLVPFALMVALALLVILVDLFVPKRDDIVLGVGLVFSAIFVAVLWLMLALTVFTAVLGGLLLWSLPDVAFLHHMMITFGVLAAFIIVTTVLRPMTVPPSMPAILSVESFDLSPRKLFLMSPSAAPKATRKNRMRACAFARLSATSAISGPSPPPICISSSPFSPFSRTSAMTRSGW